VDDLARAALFLMQHYSSADIITVGTGKDIRIIDFAQLICDVVGCSAPVANDRSNGTPQKLLDVSRLTAMGWQASIGLREGLEQTC